jgi:perosamine synthetase
MTNLQAAVGVAQMERANYFMAERDRIFNTYKHFLLPHGFFMNPHLDGTRPVNWLTSVLLPSGTREDRDRLLAELKTHGVETRTFFYPMSAMPIYGGEDNPVSAKLSARGFNLPTFPELTDEQIRHVSESLLEAAKHILV